MSGLSGTTTTQRVELTAYLTPQFVPHSQQVSPTKRFARRIVPAPLRPHVARVATDLVQVRERRRARTLVGAPLRLHLGCAASPKEGWLNVDLVGHGADLAWNLRRRLPFPDCSADAVFHEHVLEHFSPEHGLVLLDECFRLLRPGGTVRVGVPDARAYAQSYLAGGRGMIEKVRPGRPTPMLALEEIFYHHGHKAMYDAETLTFFIRAAGFKDVAERSFGDSVLSPAPDSTHRREETIYVEGTR
jgi:predicted SAM-dependent methyltransferase